MKKKSIGPGFLRGMQEAVAHSKGALKLKETTKELPGPAPQWSANAIRHLRKDVYALSQEEFALLLNVKAPTVRSWEQGQKIPSGSAARLLEVFRADKMIIKKLAKAG
jgi:DNA-binding transcriptional regulator YiaG